MGGSSVEKIGWLWILILTGVAAHKLRRGHEPYIYKNIASSNPQIFPFESQVGGATDGDEMKMLLGTREDEYVMMKRKPVSTLSTQSPAIQDGAEDVLENMMEVMEMEEKHNNPSDEKMLPVLKEVMESANSTEELQTRMAPQTSNRTIISIEDTIRDFLAISGIDALLPLDCGKHPTSPEVPLPRAGTYPWVAALGSSEDGKFHYHCTGVLITQHHILTDADCATSPNINVVMMNVTEAPGPGAILNYVAGRRVHPLIRDDDDLVTGNNIGILELGLPYEFNDYVQPICLAGQFEEPDPNETDEVTIIGFTVVDIPGAGRMAGLYNWGGSPTLGAAVCYFAIKDLKEESPETKTTLEDILTKKHICVDRPFEQVGKSVIVRVDENTQRVRIVGLGGVANAAKTNPIAYTLVQPHRFWVELVLKKFQDNTAPRRPVSPPPDSEF